MILDNVVKRHDSTVADEAPIVQVVLSDAGVCVITINEQNVYSSGSKSAPHGLDNGRARRVATYEVDIEIVSGKQPEERSVTHV
jgi:hypothetical protein